MAMSLLSGLGLVLPRTLVARVELCCRALTDEVQPAVATVANGSRRGHSRPPGRCGRPRTRALSSTDAESLRPSASRAEALTSGRSENAEELPPKGCLQQQLFSGFLNALFG